MKRITYASKKNTQKSSIKAASALNEIPVMYQDLDAQAGRSHYEMTVYDDFSFDLKYTGGSNDFMPDIHVTAVKEDDGRYALNPDIKFPELNGEEVNYADSIQYILNEWSTNIGKLCSAMMKETYSNDDYYDSTEGE